MRGGISMKRAFFILVYALASCGAASAQVPKAPAASVLARTAAATPAPAPMTPAPFGCDAGAPNVCYFRIFYTRGDRIVILPAGMKEKKIPVIAGGSYCMTLNKSPVYKCVRKVVNDKYNS
jgi:hypothetical protein